MQRSGRERGPFCEGHGWVLRHVAPHIERGAARFLEHRCLEHYEPRVAELTFSPYGNRIIGEGPRFTTDMFHVRPFGWRPTFGLIPMLHRVKEAARPVQP